MDGIRHLGAVATAALALLAAPSAAQDLLGPVHLDFISMTRALLAVPSAAQNPGLRRELPEGPELGVWSFPGEAGEVVVIEVRSDAFDPVVHLWSPAGAEIGFDDDGGGGVNARMLAVLPMTGRYHLGVSRLSLGVSRLSLLGLDVGGLDDIESAPYEVEVSRARVEPILLNGPAAEGDLDDDDGINAWSFFGEAGDVVVLEASSEVFDPALQLVLATEIDIASLREAIPNNDPDEFSLMQHYLGLRTGMVVGSEDAGGLGTDARLVVALPFSGRYLATVSSTARSGSGPYNVQVAKPTAQEVEFGASAAGFLSRQDRP